jgi:hypothetical protein
MVVCTEVLTEVLTPPVTVTVVVTGGKVVVETDVVVVVEMLVPAA